MRVIGGELRGRRLVAPAGTATRPTSDRVREAVFDMLDSRFDLADARVADLFAGSGALGIEAISRGASTAVFVDNDPAAANAVRANAAALGLGSDRVTVVQIDVMRWIGGRTEVDLVFADPPYRFEGWDDLLASLPGSVAVLESDHELAPPDGWEVVRSRRHGTTVVTLMEHADDNEAR